nr:hypothetical protein [Chloroflexota bacterium]
MVRREQVERWPSTNGGTNKRITAEQQAGLPRSASMAGDCNPWHLLGVDNSPRKKPFSYSVGEGA